MHVTERETDLSQVGQRLPRPEGPTRLEHGEHIATADILHSEKDGEIVDVREALGNNEGVWQSSQRLQRPLLLQDSPQHLRPLADERAVEALHDDDIGLVVALREEDGAVLAVSHKAVQAQTRRRLGHVEGREEEEPTEGNSRAPQ